VPNRGEVQGDIFLNGVPYLQTVQDVTTGQAIGIHVEPGIWMCVPSTKDPSEPENVVRMGSIPHGTTICAPTGTDHRAAADRRHLDPDPVLADRAAQLQRIELAARLGRDAGSDRSDLRASVSLGVAGTCLR
jgi:hypothetical protein